MNNEVRDVYAARKPGWPGFVAIAINDNPKWVANDISEWIRDGYEIVGLITRHEAIVGFQEFADEKKRRATEQAKANLPENSLFT